MKSRVKRKKRVSKKRSRKLKKTQKLAYLREKATKILSGRKRKTVHEIASKYKISYSKTPQQMKGWSAKQKREYYQRIIDISKGTYEEKRFELFKENYINAMKKQGIPEDKIDLFIDLTTKKNLQNKDVYDRLPDMKTIYDYSGNETQLEDLEEYLEYALEEEYSGASDF